jgi:hypothetical protein
MVVVVCRARCSSLLFFWGGGCYKWILSPLLWVPKGQLGRAKVTGLANMPSSCRQPASNSGAVAP